MGRHTEYTPEMGKYICELIATNPISVKKLCAKHDEIPEHSTIYKWRSQQKEFADQYARARASQAEMMAETLDDLADEVKTYFDSEGNERVDGGSVQQQRLKIDNRKWYASKLAPKIYGDRKELEQVQNENAQIKEELARLRAELAAANRKEY